MSAQRDADRPRGPPSADTIGSTQASPWVAKSRDERKRVEMPFAHLKTHYGFERLRQRSGARDEFHLAAIVRNLKTLAGQLIRPPPPRPAYARVALLISAVALVA